MAIAKTNFEDLIARLQFQVLQNQLVQIEVAFIHARSDGFGKYTIGLAQLLGDEFGRWTGPEFLEEFF